VLQTTFAAKKERENTLYKTYIKIIRQGRKKKA